jgi:hypothetical protein
MVPDALFLARPELAALRQWWLVPPPQRVLTSRTFNRILPSQKPMGQVRCRRSIVVLVPLLLQHQYLRSGL